MMTSLENTYTYRGGQKVELEKSSNPQQEIFDVEIQEEVAERSVSPNNHEQEHISHRFGILVNISIFDFYFWLSFS